MCLWHGPSYNARGVNNTTIDRPVNRYIGTVSGVVATSRLGLVADFSLLQV